MGHCFVVIDLCGFKCACSSFNDVLLLRCKMLQHIELDRATLELLTFCHNGVKSTLEPVQYLQDVVKVRGLREI